MTTLSPQPPQHTGTRPASVARPIELSPREALAIGVLCVRWQASIDPTSAGLRVALPVGTRIVALKAELTSRLSVCWVDSRTREHPVRGEWEGLCAEWRHDAERDLTHIDVGDWLRTTLDADRRVLYVGGELIRCLGILGGRLGVPEAGETGSGAG